MRQAPAFTLSATAASFIVSGSNLDAAVAAAGGTISKRLPAINAVVVEGSEAVRANLAGKKGVSRVLPNLSIRWLPKDRLAKAEVVGEAVDPPNNPPGTIDSRFNLQWGHTAVKAVAAWNAGQTGQGARVAVLDGGFSLNHPDIASKFDRRLQRRHDRRGHRLRPERRRPDRHLFPWHAHRRHDRRRSQRHRHDRRRAGRAALPGEGAVQLPAAGRLAMSPPVSCTRPTRAWTSST